MKIEHINLISGSTLSEDGKHDAEALLSIRATGIHHRDLSDAIQGLPALLSAARDAQCECTPSQRNSGHRLECWFPALQEALNAIPK